MPERIKFDIKAYIPNIVKTIVNIAMRLRIVSKNKKVEIPTLGKELKEVHKGIFSSCFTYPQHRQYSLAAMCE